MRSLILATLGVGATGCGGSTEGDQQSPVVEQPAADAGVASCTNPLPALTGDVPPTGWGDRGDWLHRAAQRECPSSLPRPEGIDLTNISASCARDEDCTEQPHGHCEIDTGGELGPSSVCLYGCVRDEDCYAGAVCICGYPVGTCATATCTTDADCGEQLCAATHSVGVCGGFGTWRVACTSDCDECRTRADCPDAECVTEPDRRICYRSDAVCGRPFVVGGAARTADLVACDAWVREQVEAPPTLDASVAHGVAEHWAHVAAMEHASVAAFARFILDLMALGAPSELVRDAQAALSDEIEHAERCFSLASQFAGRALGPGPLDIAGALVDRSQTTIVATAIVEACIGETLAALEAGVALEHAHDPEVRATLSRIAADESRHAALGFRFLGWALRSATRDERDTIVGTLAREVDALTTHTADSVRPWTPGNRALAAYGVVPDSERPRIHREARAVITPCVAALLRSPGWRESSELATSPFAKLQSLSG